MWRRLTPTDFYTHLAQDEIDKLQTASVSQEALNHVLQGTLDQVADAFRGAWLSKGYTIDVREHFVAPEYVSFILDYARFTAWSRLPLSEDYSLGQNDSSPRQKLYDQAAELLKNPYLGVSRPDYSDDPDLSGRTDLSGVGGTKIDIPWLRFPPMPFEEGFPEVYWSDKWRFL